MTTTTPVPESDPVLRLLHELLRRDEARAEKLEQMQTSLDKLEHGNQQQKSYNERTTANFEELKGALQRQDGQITALDQRIAGNYRGQVAQGDLILGEIKESTERLSNIERALVGNHRHTMTLQGSLLEEGNRLGTRVGQAESAASSAVEVALQTKSAVSSLSGRVDAIEKRQEAAAV